MKTKLTMMVAMAMACTAVQLTATPTVEEMKGTKTYGGYTWSYRVRNGEATLVAEKDGKYSCALSPTPTGKVSIPPTLNSVQVTRIGWEAFLNCKELTAVTIPEGVTHIDGRAFDLCGGLKSVTLPSSLKEIGFAVFGKCVGLTSVKIPNGVKCIGPDAFNGCGLKSVVIPESVTRMGDRAFGGCRELESVTMCGECPKAQNDIFRKCGKLKSIHVPANAKSWAGMKTWQGIPLVFDAK